MVSENITARSVLLRIPRTSHGDLPLVLTCSSIFFTVLVLSAGEKHAEMNLEIDIHACK